MEAYKLSGKLSVSFVSLFYKITEECVSRTTLMLPETPMGEIAVGKDSKHL